MTEVYGKSATDQSSKPASVTAAAPVAVGSAKATPTYTYNSATKSFAPVTGSARNASQGATALIDVKTATKQIAYFDNKGGFWMVA